MQKVTCISCGNPYEVGDYGEIITKRCPPCQKDWLKSYNTKYQRRYRRAVRDLKKRGIKFKLPVSVSIFNDEYVAYFTPDGQRKFEGIPGGEGQGARQ